MAGVIGNITEFFSIFWETMPPALTEQFSSLIGIFKAVGIAFLLYLVFLIIKSTWILGVLKKLKRVEVKVDKLDEKLNELVNMKFKEKIRKEKRKRNKKKS